MCVVIIKNKGVEMPSVSELRDAYNHNPHGCGFVSSNGLYWRGMSFKEFLKRIKGVGTEDACIIHFRIATHGSHKVTNCHPFRHNDIYFAHNGVLDIRTYGDMTDSETLFLAKLVPTIERYGLYSPELTKVVEKHIGFSKFAFMQNGQIRAFGRWIEDENGCFYSNLNHRAFVYGYNVDNWFRKHQYAI